MFWDVLYNLTVMPIQMLIEFIFALMYKLFENPGIAIIFVSLAVQLLVLPLYKKSDAMQDQERQKQKEMEHWVKHIKKTFSGDERFMMLQAYYREVGYKPAYAIKGSFSLLLQIPFFMAAYNYLSSLAILKGAPLLFITDLSRPDGLIQLGGISINLLPVLMTVFNIISGIIYTKGFPLKDKVQTYGLAAVFLVLLYQSPSGLVFYWTLNNLFSLFKNIFMKIIKNPKPVIAVISAAFGILVFGGRVLYFFNVKPDEAIISEIFLVICLIPLGALFIERWLKKGVTPEEYEASKKKTPVPEKAEKSLFTLASVLSTIFIGAAIPLSVIGSSVAEFFTDKSTPVELFIRTFAVVIGFFIVWCRIFYALCSDLGKHIFTMGLCFIGIGSIVNYYCFSMNMGTMNTVLKYDYSPYFDTWTLLLNTGILLLIAGLVYLLYKKKIKLLTRVCQIATLTLTLVCIMNSVNVVRETASFNRPEKVRAEDSEPIYHLSKNGKNVVVFMLDRAISGYIPYFLKEKPELADIYEGFTYYPNTMSYGGNTNFAAPALFGGYDYTPKAMNARDKEFLRKKHNESLLMMPTLFSEKGYRVTITDPPYANYRWDTDLSIYNGMANVKAYKTEGKYKTDSSAISDALADVMQRHNFVMFGFMKAAPTFLHNFFYDSGDYMGTEGSSVFNPSFFNWYSGLETLKELTDVSSDGADNLLLLQNATTHEAMQLKEPDYVPSSDANTYVDPYDDRFVVNGHRVDVRDTWDFNHYQINMAALLRVGEWIQYLKDQGVYDNTRIIIVADHGYPMGQFDYMLLENGIDVERFNPLFMVKDFDAHGQLKTDDSFMTNADVPTIAMKDVIKDPVNPFTGNPVNTDRKSDPQYITTSENWQTAYNNGLRFDTTDGYWYRVRGNIFDVKNWLLDSKGDK
ncbi:MAG: membrane protein insertase YidC [Lachnospiraceae bacterium]|nr:membrane protein insertase YidC [Lachnospiraceae bacterium]